jgi:hypothetical protein
VAGGKERLRICAAILVSGLTRRSKEPVSGLRNRNGFVVEQSWLVVGEEEEEPIPRLSKVGPRIRAEFSEASE